jgi:hypothetical protein
MQTVGCTYTSEVVLNNTQLSRLVESRINNKNKPDNLLSGSLFNLLETSPLNNLKGIERLLS